MKKTILTAIFAAAVLGMSAQETYYYTPAGEPSTAYRLTEVGSGDNADVVKVGDEVVQLIRVPDNVVASVAGSNVASVTFYSGLYVDPDHMSDGYQKPKYSTVDVILCHGLKETPFYAETTSVPDGYLTKKTLDLATPQLVEAGRPLYVGVRLKVANELDFYLPVDGQTGSAVEGNNYAYVVTDDASNSADWHRGASQGNACIRVTFEGSTLPSNGVSFVSGETPVAVNTGTPFAVPVTVRGTAANKAATVTVDYRIDGQTKSWTGNVLDPVTREPRAIGQGETGLIEVSGIVSSNPSTSSLLYLSGTKVNGSDNFTASNSTLTMTFPTFTLDEGFERIPVMEEATSVNCAWCPSGIALMNYLEEEYPGSFIAIAYHVNFSGNDPMTVGSGQQWVNYYAKGYPFGLYNRDTRANAMLGRVWTFAELAKIADDYYAKVRSANTYAGIELKADFTDDSKTAVKADAKVKFALDMPAGEGYKISYALTQDKMGPYRQSNSYAGSDYDMAGWQDLGARPTVFHNHVARELVGFPGVDNSVKAQMRKGEECDHSQVISLENVTGSRVKVVAMLVNNLTRQVANARVVELRIREDEPDFSHMAATYDDPFMLELSCSEGARIHYTLDGNDPTEDSPVYTEPIRICEQRTTVKAYAENLTGELSDSEVIKNEYRVRKYEKPNAIDEIEAAADAANVEWYNLQGVRVARPLPGAVYVKVTDGVAEKVLVK